jgi:hypothetical protein
MEHFIPDLKASVSTESRALFLHAGIMISYIQKAPEKKPF